MKLDLLVCLEWNIQRCYGISRHSGDYRIRNIFLHYNDVIMGAMASQITRRKYSGTDQRKHQSSALLALCAGNSPVTGEFPAQRASNAENVSIRWRHHEKLFYKRFSVYSLLTRWRQSKWPTESRDTSLVHNQDKGHKIYIFFMIYSEMWSYKQINTLLGQLISTLYNSNRKYSIEIK